MKVFIIFLSFFSVVYADIDDSLRRVQSHLIIKDYPSAFEEAQEAMRLYPHSELIHESYIKTLAAIGDEKQMLAAWNNYTASFPDKKNNRELIEEMCWGVLHKASSSSSLATRLMSLLGAFFSQDSRGITMLKQGLNDPNSAIRSVAVLLSGHLRDAKLIEEIKRLYTKETVWNVRKEIIPAVGKMKIRELSTDLENLIASDRTLAEEKALAIAALVSLYEEDQMKRESIQKLAQSDRAGLRLLACKVIAHFRLARDTDLAAQLANDNHPEVRMTALQTLGLIRPTDPQYQVVQIAKSHLNDAEPKVGIAAAWLLTLYSPHEGQRNFEMLLNHMDQSVRILAAAALAHTGRYGVSSYVNNIRIIEDPYVQLNLALGMIGQQIQTDLAGQILDYVLSSQPDKWIWYEEGIFKAVAPKNVKKGGSDAISDTEMDNQLVRLEILNTLSMISPQMALEAIRKYLMVRPWGVSGAAAGVLLMEGDEAAVDSVQQLLKDKNSKLRIQAALMLSLWSRDEKAIGVLEESYWNVENDLKGKILEGIGRIGSMKSVPFLMEVLEEPSQHLRIIGATVLIQCLNH